MRMIAKSTKSSSMATAEAKREGSQSLEQSSEEATSEGKEGSQNLRGNLIDVAVKFLNNPRVVASPLDQKKAFLKKKGLSDSEIAEAIRLSELTPPSLPPPPLPPRPPSHPSPFTTHTPSPPHLVSRSWRDYALVAAVLGTMGYAIYRFVTSYAIPWLNARLEQSDRLDEISTTVRQLHTNLDTTVSGISETTGVIRDTLTDQQEQIRSITSQVTALQSSVPGCGMATKEIQEELASLKGLLLNRHQFPTPIPPALSHSTPGIPSWQRTPQRHPTEDNSDDTAAIVNGHREESSEGDGGERGSDEGEEGKGLGGEDVKSTAELST